MVDLINHSWRGGRVEYCSVVASSEGKSSHNIYIYGRRQPDEYNGMGDIFFILTFPAFGWVQVYSSNISNADTRQIYQHQCQKVHERYMIACRGLTRFCDNDWSFKRFPGMPIYEMPSLTWTTQVELDVRGSVIQDLPRFSQPRVSLIKRHQLMTLPTNNYSQSRPFVGAIAGSIAGGFVLVLFITAFFLLRRRRRMVAPPQLPEMPRVTEVFRQ